MTNSHDLGTGDAVDPATPRPGSLMSIEEVQQAIGDPTVYATYRRARLGQLPGVVRIGRNVRFNRMAVARFLEGEHAEAQPTARSA